MKVLLLPYNTASDLSHKVRTLRSLGVDARGLAIGGHAVQSADGISLTPQISRQFVRNRARRLPFFYKLWSWIRWADILHWTWDFGTMPFRLDRTLVNVANKPGVIQWAGSDIRIPELDAEVNPYYKAAFSSGYEYWHESREKSLAAQRDFAEVGFEPLSIIGLDQYIDRTLFPNVHRTWQSVVLSDHEPHYPSMENRRPLIVHSPTAPVAKGTRFILEAIEVLKSRHDFDFKLVENMPRRDALQVMKSCDIYVDQIILGCHGSAAVEAMAFGKPVICYINPVIGKDYPADLPIVNANPDSITTVLEGLIKDPTERNRLGRLGRQYVEKYHSDERIARGLLSTYEEVMSRHASRAR